ncbi:MAG TPA: hypothetical protein VMF08_23960 [Candidatus Sulfotelmatobacter sp.]|nr:hypothetical protein [Candidatus Sulfotelmatobacter sp.]
MSFIKKHYEKVLLGAVLLGLFVALLALPVEISHDKQEFDDLIRTFTHPKPKVLPPLDMSMQDIALDRVKSPYELDFENTNRLFNPMPWQMTPDHRLIELEYGNEVGPNAVNVAKIVPLYYIVRLDSIEPANQFSPARYVVSVERQDDPIAGKRRPRKHWLSVGEKDSELSLISATGPAANPELTLQLVASGEQITISTNKPFSEVTAYAADLEYTPLNQESHRWNDQRVGAMLNLNGNDYKVVVIDANEVVLSAQANQKKTTRPYSP